MTTNDQTKRLKARITGRVQGVGFRAFTQRKAHSMGLTGWVRNEPDGSVRLEADGEKERLEELLGYLQDGPSLSSVDDVEAQWTEPERIFDDFRVRHH